MTAPTALRRSRTQVAVVALLAVVTTAALAIAWQAQHERAQADAQLRQYGPSRLDLGFLNAMTAHHRQAIVLAQVLLAGPPSAMAPMARGIVASQTLELGEMRGWLRLWAQPLEVLKPTMDWMLLGPSPVADELRQYLLDCAAAPTGMVGLVDDATIDAFRNSDPSTRDAQFIALMRAHHLGGLPMARFAAEHAEVPAVRALARQIVIEQSNELGLLERLHALQQSRAR